MIQYKPPITPRCNNLSLAGKRPVRIKSPLTRIQYLPGFRGSHNIMTSSLYEEVSSTLPSTNTICLSNQINIETERSWLHQNTRLLTHITQPKFCILPTYLDCTVFQLLLGALTGKVNISHTCESLRKWFILYHLQLVVATVDDLWLYFRSHG